MKNLILIFAICFALSIVARAQTQCVVPQGFVCITQQQADKIAHDLDELKASRDLIATYVAQGKLTDAERAAALATLKAANDVIASAANAQAISDHLIQLQQKVIEMYSALVEKLTAEINKPKSGFQKLIAVLEKIMYIAAGVSFGRVLK